MANDAPSVTTSYLTSPRELWVAHLRLLRFRTTAWLLTTLYGVVVATIILLIWYRPPKISWLPEELAYVGIIWVVVLSTSYVRIRTDHENRVESSLTADSGGLSSAFAHSQGHYEWSAFDRVRPLRNGIAVRMAQSRTWFWIASDWFPSEDEFLMFRKILVDGIETSKWSTPA